MKQRRNRITRLCIAVLAVLTLTCVGLVGFATQAQPVEGPVCYNHGDMNADGALDSRDAVYTLYHYLFGEEEYPVLQDWDFNKDESLDSRDAIYVLCAYNFQGDPNYQLDGIVHTYYEPTWQWNGTEAVATFKCGCGQTLSVGMADGVSVKEGASKAATCVQAGSVEYIAEVTLNGQLYTASKVSAIPARAGGHEMVEGTCTAGSYCANCEYTVAAPGHKWGVAAELSSDATCTANAVQAFRCAVCQETKTVIQENTAGHELEYVQDVAKGNCLYVKQYHCAACGQDFDGVSTADSYYKHTYKATLTKEATCKQQGEKTYTCTECADSYVVLVEKNDSHAWDNGVTAGGVTTYTCKDCGATKTAVAVAADKSVNKEALESAQELQLGNDTSMKLDESVVENLDANREIKISADALSEQQKEQVSSLLTEEQKEQIGDNTVYDFNMVYADNNDKVDFNGTITVSLPYTLQPGEDIDSIDVWYIADDGTLERVDGTYSNGFVTFTTDHFSYYTVTRLTAAQRCERYGHIPVTSQKAASCTEDGYTMSQCQRCMAELSKEIYGRTGHNYVTTVTVATCTADGVVVNNCRNCGNAVTEIIPAEGHNLVLDQSKSSAASCTAAGKNVYVCDRDACGYVREDELAQLEHNYVNDEVVVADCTKKGIATKTCADCGDVVVLSETAPLGHSFDAKSAAWSWSKDLSSATVTLYCEHDNAHTKVLNAVVTEKIVQSSCEVAGSVTYTAAASFNNVTYTDEVATSQAAPGHQPGEAWQAEKNQHFHICTTCGEKVDAAVHNWNEGTVIQAATCAESGKRLVQCTVCNVEQEKTIPATGNHTYVNGICSVCNYDESSCDHIVLKETVLDLSAYNVCEGVVLHVYGCECKQKARLEFHDTGACQFEEEVTVETLPNGENYEKYTYRCAQCGLVASGAAYECYEADPCRFVAREEYTLSVGETQIINARFEQYTQAHPVTEEISIIDLSNEEYGLCGMKLIVRSCLCGEITRTNQHESYCNWQEVGYEVIDDVNTWTYECVACGAVKVNRDWSERAADGCYEVYTDVYTFYVNGKEIYSYSNVHEYEAHNDELTEYELYGDSCEDGLLSVHTCKDCGTVTKRFVTYHEEILETEFDFSNEDICFDGLVQKVCPCGAYGDHYIIVANGHCQWGPLVEGISSICSECGATVESVTTVTKDDMCVVTYNSVHTYRDKNGKELACVSSTRTEIEHNIQTEYKLLGESCLDGVEITEFCTNCDMYDNWTVDHHYSIQTMSVNLSEYGMCDGFYTLYSCPCGQDVWEESAFSCNYENGYGDENWEEIYCSNCSFSRRYYFERLEQVDECHVIRREGTMFLKDGEVILDGTYVRLGEDHDDVYVATLKPGATDCNDGVYVVATCKTCGRVDSWETQGHDAFIISSEVYGEGVICSPIHINKYSCACGQNAGTDMYYMGDQSCQWGPENWSDDYNAYVSTCYVCGVTRKHYEVQTPVEGENCQYVINEVMVYYDQDGNEMFSYENSWHSTRHQWINELELIGSTCDDGYYVSSICAKCGVDGGRRLEYGCSWYDFSRTLVCDDETTCAPVYIVRDGCACGNLSSVYIDSDCSFSHYGYDEKLQLEMQQCQFCGLKLGRTSYYAEGENVCSEIRTEVYRFFRDDVEVGYYEETYSRANHKMIYSYSLRGETCMDGYDFTGTCYYCGETTYGTDWAHNENDHGTRLTAYYDLGDFGLCDYNDARISQYSCACGRESYVNSDIRCIWHHVDHDPDTGVSQYYCQECESTWYYGDGGVLDTETCIYTGTYIAKWERNGEVLLSVELPIKDKRHTMMLQEVTFNEPGGDCESGYTVLEKCMYCDQTNYNYRSGHETYRIQQIDLKEMGACGGSVSLWSCPCGKNTHTNNDWNCSMTYTSSDDGNGTHTETRVCSQCGLTIVTDCVTTTPEGSCYGTNDYVVTVTMADKSESMTYSESYEAHQYVRTGVSFDVPGGDCESGYTAYMTCMVCGDSCTRHYYHHSSDIIGIVDLSELGACGGTVEVYGCACGRDGSRLFNTACNTSYEFESDGNETEGYSKNIYTCVDCGLKIEDCRVWTKPADTCKRSDVYQITVTMGDTVRYFECTNQSYYHEYEYTYALKPGSVSCTDGLYAYASCIYCGDSYTTNSYSHNATVVDSIDLTKYGSVCGAALNHYSCLCGELNYYQLSEDCECDFDSVYVSDWIENDLNEGQQTTEGWQACWTNAYVYTCAVTDPACGMQIRMASYWVKEGCSAKQYETWQLGYNELTGECLYEFTIETGEEVAFHDYQCAYIDETQADGIYVCGEQYTCEDCGSIYYNKSYYLDNVHIKSETVKVNTLDNGENRKSTYISEYDRDLSLQYNFGYATRSYTETVYADGEVYWSQDTYEYDFSNGCKAIHTYTNSDGSNETYEESAHRCNWSRTRELEPTCTQHGMDVEMYVCVACGVIESMEYYEVAPNAHDWRWNSEESIYYCGLCGLENVFGASGAIVLEDLTASQGNGTDYVIGYWDREDVNFGLYVSLVPEGTDDDEEIVLSNIAFNYLTAENHGVRAISCDKEQVAAAAAATGYTGNYSVRIIFVPLTGEHSLDYAITLINQTAQ